MTMNYTVDKSIQHLLVDITKLTPLLNNPRKGNVDAIAASYKEFGQVKPIVARPNDDGTLTVLAGNHQLLAAKKLGWTHIAVVQYDADDKKAVAFALADNRTNELGYTDPTLLKPLISEIDDTYPELLDGLEWDMFEMASINEQIARIEKSSDSEVGYVAPVMVQPPQYLVQETESGNRIVPSGKVDDRSVAVSGSTSIGASGVKNAVVQYSLVFDNVEQQNQWYAFTRWLRNEPSIDGDTIAEKIINFIDAHADYR